MVSAARMDLMFCGEVENTMQIIAGELFRWWKVGIQSNVECKQKKNVFALPRTTLPIYKHRTTNSSPPNFYLVKMNTDQVTAMSVEEEAEATRTLGALITPSSTGYGVRMLTTKPGDATHFPSKQDSW